MLEYSRKVVVVQHRFCICPGGPLQALVFKCILDKDEERTRNCAGTYSADGWPTGRNLTAGH